MKYLAVLCFIGALLNLTAGAPAVEIEGCLYKGVEYPAGSTYKQDCNTCHCSGNNLGVCTLMACISVDQIGPL
ncbi:hypothetical protein V1264_001937 [Littorina saxatilis]|uniref:Pacifastin domain-containing protein n=1 Tax=Littorina saxatilis TaxID=31220 RepID=A0AAN9C2K0_9CAEN